MKKEFLRRYTELRHVQQMLRTGKLAFLDPNTWDDRNDSHFLMAYKEAKQCKSLLAVCFTQVSERHHHWERFATRGVGKTGSRAKSGDENWEPICVEFNKARLLASLKPNLHVISGAVTYSRLEELEKQPPRLERWPFTKRYPYRDEEEFRIIYSNRRSVTSPMMLRIDLGAIQRIIVGPYGEIDRREEIKAQIRAALPNGEPPEITKTTILDNTRWKRIVDGAKKVAERG